MIAGDTVLAAELRATAADAGWAVAGPAEAEGMASPALVLEVLAVGEEPEAPLQGGPHAICCAAGSLAGLDPGGRRRLPRPAAAVRARGWWS